MSPGRQHGCRVLPEAVGDRIGNTIQTRAEPEQTLARFESSLNNATSRDTTPPALPVGPSALRDVVLASPTAVPVSSPYDRHHRLPATRGIAGLSASGGAFRIPIPPLCLNDVNRRVETSIAALRLRVSLSGAVPL